jgi:hypothetical protein
MQGERGLLAPARLRHSPSRSSPLSHVRRHWERGLFLVGLVLLILACGIVIGRQRLWPMPAVEAASAAVEDWRQNWRHYLGRRSKYLVPTSRTQGGVTINQAALVSPGLTFFTAFRDGRFGAWLIDADGRLVHSWAVRMAELFPQPPAHLDATPPDWDINVQGSALLPNGDVILNIYSTGLARLDRCSRPLWVLPEATHHSVDVLPDGRILSPIRIERFSEPRADLPRVGLGPEGWTIDDGVALISPDGEILREHSMLRALHESGREGILVAGSAATRTSDGDPLHLNDVEMLRPELAPMFPMFAAGDLLVSFRDKNTIAVLDGDSWRIKWSLTGVSLRQHDPDFMPNGHIMLYDNRPAPAGVERRTRIIEIDPANGEVVWSYDGGADNKFFAQIRGMQVPLPNGNVLVSDPSGGRIFEISRSHGDQVVWEYVNLVQPGWVGTMLDVERVDPAKLDFLGQSCS